jgi:hypothetical protein
MRKMTVEIAPGPPFSDYLAQVFDQVVSYEILGLLKLDFEHGIKVGVMEVQMREGYTLDDFELPPPAELVSVLQEVEGKYTCIVKVHVPKEMLGFFKKADIDIIWDTPMRMSSDRMILSVMGDDDELKQVLELFGEIGEVVKVHVQRPIFHQDDILASLTDRQKEVLVQAKRFGYYDYPRRMNATDLSTRIGISKATLVEHLRKAEGRLLAQLLAGY